MQSLDDPAQTRPTGRRPERLLLVLDPQYRERVWGGRRLHPDGPPVGEAWLAFGESRVVGGPLAGRSLDELRLRYGAELVGRGVAGRYPDRWPLLVKLLDCADWLSIQVHPDDEQARRMVGADQSGKTEAWYFIETSGDASILMGVKPGVTAAGLAEALRQGRAADVVAKVAARAGEAVLIPAGTLHSLGPGILLYEIQQQSDITYRAYDWGRPQSDGRALHIDESVAVASAEPPQPRWTPRPPEPAGLVEAVACPYFRLELGRVAGSALSLDADGRSFHVLTAIDGDVLLASGTETVRLAPFGTCLVAACAGSYTVVSASGSARFLRASVPS